MKTASVKRSVLVTLMFILIKKTVKVYFNKKKQSRLVALMLTPENQSLVVTFYVNFSKPADINS